MNIKIKYCLLTLVITMLFVTACSSKDSGLYRIEAGTDGSGASDSAEYDPASDKPEADNGNVGTDPTGGLSVNSTDSVAQTSDSVTSDSTSVSQDVNNSAPADTPVSTLQSDILYVHVCGAVNTPGVYELKNGDRVFTAIRKAGGFTEEADESFLNLAMAVCDGMKIDVPTVEETSGENADRIQAVTIAQEQIAAGGGTGSSGTGGTSSSGSGAVSTGQQGVAGTASSGSSTAASTASGKVNINTADISGLTSISGIGKTRAEAIISYREEHGAFLSVEDIKNVSGIGDATFEKIKDQITVN